jgi:signal peptidase II
MNSNPCNLNSTQRSWRIAVIIFISVIVDQLSKKIAVLYLMGHLPLIFFGNLFRLDYVENAGAFLSLGGTLSPEMRFWVLNVAVAIFLLILLYSLVVSKTMTRFQIISLTLVCGGGISNLIDRFFRHNGQVIDFMNMGIGSLRTGVFNVADVFIMFGIIAFAFTNYRQPQQK